MTWAFDSPYLPVKVRGPERITQVSQDHTANSDQSQDSNAGVLTRILCPPHSTATNEDYTLHFPTFDKSLATKVCFGPGIKQRLLCPGHLWYPGYNKMENVVLSKRVAQQPSEYDYCSWLSSVSFIQPSSPTVDPYWIHSWLYMLLLSDISPIPFLKNELWEAPKAAFCVLAHTTLTTDK